MRYRLQSFISTTSEANQQEPNEARSHPFSRRATEDIDFVDAGGIENTSNPLSSSCKTSTPSSMHVNGHATHSPLISYSGGWFTATVHAPATSLSTNNAARISGRRACKTNGSHFLETQNFLVNGNLVPAMGKQIASREFTQSPFSYSSGQLPKNGFRRPFSALLPTNDVSRVIKDDDEQSVYELLSLKSLCPPLEEISQKTAKTITISDAVKSNADVTLEQQKQQIALLEQENAKLRAVQNSPWLSNLMLQIFLSIFFVVIYFAVWPHLKVLFGS